ncbi:RRQRL motif-containing zinc-binding protein [Streptomyces johnsoniae]|uniref:RRQRL motif-containing zinc-binding protein n=1 Tax=Streptomyces johnsoniae TaxID=3075532 RepID=A0ABU2SAF3_9ACTN|nr:RRQRL motif-containing zinc-binding protein [Streptomyces sp. DSM 41886]MDT0445959.1 RRQRL motif-containing zinc-binding protein [Streptomyces sp. DSM 41886]
MSAAYAEVFDPDGARHGIPTYPWRLAPEGLATRRQLRARGLRPGGQEPVAQVMRLRRRGHGALIAYLYRIDRAMPVRPMTPARWSALDCAMRARRTCPACRLVADYCIPRSLGLCVPCAYPEPAAARGNREEP